MLCVPVRNGGDQIIAAIAAQLLTYQGFEDTAGDAQHAGQRRGRPRRARRTPRSPFFRSCRRRARAPAAIYASGCGSDMLTCRSWSGLWDAGDEDDVPQRFARDGATYVSARWPRRSSRIRSLATAALNLPRGPSPRRLSRCVRKVLLTLRREGFVTAERDDYGETIARVRLGQRQTGLAALRDLLHWEEDDGNQMAAAVAYYMALSFFPLMLMTLAVGGLLLRSTGWGQNFQGSCCR